MTQMRIPILLGFCLSVSVVPACGPRLDCGEGTERAGNRCVSPRTTPDPLLGAWTKAQDNSGRICEFFGNGEWSNTCFLTDGWAYKWERIYENRYYIGATYRACDAETVFSDDERAVTMSMLCGSTIQETVQLLRFR